MTSLLISKLLATTTAVITMKKVHIQIPEKVHTRAKVISVLKDVTLNKYFEEAIAEAIKRDKRVLQSLKD